MRSEGSVQTGLGGLLSRGDGAGCPGRPELFAFAGRDPREGRAKRQASGALPRSRASAGQHMPRRAPSPTGEELETALLGAHAGSETGKPVFHELHIQPFCLSSGKKLARV